jgi:ribonuclease HII
MLKAFFKEKQIEAGCDEAGRGCLAGPVVASAVILPTNFYHPLLNDSKQLSEKKRNELREIIQQEAISYAVGFVDNLEIDKINILNASFKAMHNAVDRLVIKPSFLLIDGNRFKPYPEINHKCIIKGDSIYASIAAASILAKTARDEYMEMISQEFPHYNWKKNKGYPTKEHKKAIQEYGINHYHRQTFKLIDPQLIPM